VGQGEVRGCNGVVDENQAIFGCADTCKGYAVTRRKNICASPFWSVANEKAN